MPFSCLPYIGQAIVVAKKYGGHASNEAKTKKQ
jgi:hypothetical protein